MPGDIPILICMQEVCMTQKSQLGLAREVVDHAQEFTGKLDVLVAAARRADDPDHRLWLLAVMADVLSMYREIFDDMKRQAEETKVPT